MSAPSSALSLPLLFAKVLSTLLPFFQQQMLILVTSCWFGLWYGVGSIVCCSPQTSTSARNCAPVQPSGTGLGSECLPAHPTPPREQRWESAVVLFSQLHLFSQQRTRFIALPLGVLGERGEKVPDGTLCCSHGGCWCLLQAYTDWEGAFSGFSPVIL